MSNNVSTGVLGYQMGARVSYGCYRIKLELAYQEVARIYDIIPIQWCYDDDDDTNPNFVKNFCMFA